MDEETKLIEIGSKVWDFRKANGFSKKLSSEIQLEIANLCAAGTTAYALEKATGVQRNTIMDWKNRFAEKNKSQFVEVSIAPESKSTYEVKLFAQVQGCRVEITGGDFSLVQRIMRKLSH